MRLNDVSVIPFSGLLHGHVLIGVVHWSTRVPEDGHARVEALLAERLIGLVDRLFQHGGVVGRSLGQYGLSLFPYPELGLLGGAVGTIDTFGAVALRFKVIVLPLTHNLVPHCLCLITQSILGTQELWWEVVHISNRVSGRTIECGVLPKAGGKWLLLLDLPFLVGFRLSGECELVELEHTVDDALRDVLFSLVLIDGRIFLLQGEVE